MVIVGSGGTLGVVVEAKVALVPLPKFKAVLAIQFADLLDGLAATPAILAHGGSRLAPLSNWVARSTPVRWLNEWLLGRDRRRLLPAWASKTFAHLFGQLHWNSMPETFKLGSGPSRVLLHGHCHQKGMGRMATARKLLGRIPRSTVIDLDAGCCGMAGSFGYVKADFEVSRAIGERRLLPAVRDMGPNSILVASGTSCRHQVADFSAVRALHPAELIRSLLSSQAPCEPPRDPA